MSLPSDPDPQVFLRVKGALKTLGMSQRDLAKQLGLAPGVVSLALSGGNEKTFRRIIEMLEQEHGIDPLQLWGEGERGDKILNELQAIKTELNGLRTEMEALKELIKNKK